MEKQGEDFPPMKDVRSLTEERQEVEIEELIMNTGRMDEGTTEFIERSSTTKV